MLSDLGCDTRVFYMPIEPKLIVKLSMRQLTIIARIYRCLFKTYKALTLSICMQDAAQGVAELLKGIYSCSAIKSKVIVSV